MGLRFESHEGGGERERERDLSLLFIPKWSLSLTKAMEIGEPLEYNAMLGKRWIFLAKYIAEGVLAGI